MAHSALPIDQITELYVGYFNRAPDPAGLNFWVAHYNALGKTPAALAGIANSFSQVPEATNLYGFLSAPLIGSPTSFLASVYLNLFNRVIDAPGSAFWAGQLALPGAIVGQVIINIISGAQGDDALVVANKTAVGVAFTQALVNNNAAFNLTTAQSAFVGVTKDPATATAKILANNGVIVATAGSAGGSTFTLTAGADNIVGTTGGDTINAVIDAVTAANTTLSVLDNINGSTGIDTLAVTTVGAAAVPGLGVISGIENLSIRHTTGTGTAAVVTATGFDQVIATSIGDLTINGLASGKAFTANGATGAPIILQNYAAAGAAGVTNLIGSTLGVVTLTNTASLTINTSGTASTTGLLDVGGAATALTINAAANLTTAGFAGSAALATITVSGAATNVNLGALVAATKTVNASGLTAGGMTVTLNATPAAGFTFTGGAGADTITTGSVLVAGMLVDAGAGTDTLVVAGNTAHVAAGPAAFYKGFDVLSLTTAVVDMDVIASGNTFSAINIGGSGTVNNVSAAQALAVTIRASSTPVINIKGATTGGQVDTLGLTISDGLAAVNTITLTAASFAGVENFNVVATDNVTFDTLATAGNGPFVSSTFSGAGAIVITATGAVALSNYAINATGHTGALTIDATAATITGITINGNSASIAVNTLTGTALGDTINSGGGADVVSGLAGNDVINTNAGNDSVTGGTGADTINVGAGIDTVNYTAVAETFAGVVTSGATVLTGIDVISGLGTGDKIATYAGVTVTGATTIGTSLLTAAGVTDAVAFVRGNYSAGTGIFTTSATGADTLFQFDDNGTTAVGNIDSVVLVGFTATATAAANLLTLL